ncbi:uncharacterized protein G2W53_026535 [Senna tora]|uniref:Uncharacterized protein n=1 Tax=Senna tora TaxID=362788 RepID=A0A834THL9_9FABA|nr:uncharacterized protein G2W53_026535 [Senna tora]
MVPFISSIAIPRKNSDGAPNNPIQTKGDSKLNTPYEVNTHIIMAIKSRKHTGDETTDYAKQCDETETKMQRTPDHDAANTGPQHDAANTETEPLAQQRRELGSLHNEP